MSYELLRSLYLGRGSNADLSGTDARRLLHVATPLEKRLATWVAEGKDAVLTGNPGDGKSHLIRHLVDAGRLEAVVEFDLSASDAPTVAARWRAAREAGKRFVLCANEGPLLDLLPVLEAVPALQRTARELGEQIGRLVAARLEGLAQPPSEVVLVDLADRSVLDPGLIAKAIRQVTLPDFLPEGTYARETTSGRNLQIFEQSEEAAERLARILSTAGQRLGEHVTFRALWQSISYALTAGRPQAALKQRLHQDADLGSFPLDFLASPTAQGPLIRAVRLYADPANTPTPELDEDIWRRGAPSDEWEAEVGPFEPPCRIWERGDPDGALRQQVSIKRLVALVHPRGEELLEAMTSQQPDLPSRQDDARLLALCIDGLRRLYLAASEEVGAPLWLREGIPLWVPHSYRDASAAVRPHVAVARIRPEELEILRPRRVAWMADALGPLPEVAWLSHRPSGVTLRLEAGLLGVLRQAIAADGPLPPPDLVQRFLGRASGWEEARANAPTGPYAILERPRGALLAAGAIETTEGGYAYGTDAPA
jgi:hypothetical protein